MSLVRAVIVEYCLTMLAIFACWTVLLASTGEGWDWPGLGLLVAQSGLVLPPILLARGFGKYFHPWIVRDLQTAVSNPVEWLMDAPLVGRWSLRRLSWLYLAMMVGDCAALYFIYSMHRHPKDGLEGLALLVFMFLRCVATIPSFAISSGWIRARLHGPSWIRGLPAPGPCMAIAGHGVFLGLILFLYVLRH